MPHEIRDSRVLAAVSHPLRRRLLDALRLDGPATASALSATLGSAVGNISHHLKVLASAGLVEEAPDLARDRRERWWRRPFDTLSWSTSDFPGDPVADAAEAVALDRQAALSREWLSSLETAEPPWRDAWFTNETWLRLSPQELASVGARIAELFAAYANPPDDGTERRPVFLFARGFPARP